MHGAVLDSARKVADLELLSDDELRIAALPNWVQLSKVLRRASPSLVYRLLRLELRSDAPREQILLRLYGKLSKYRAATERRLLLRAVEDHDAFEVVLERLAM